MRVKTVLLGFAAMIALAVMAVVQVPAQAFSGGWELNNNPGGFEEMYLGDNTNDSYRRLTGTSLYCGRPGVSYAQMRGIIERNYPEQLNWWIDDECQGGYVRVCVENWQGETGCSTYSDGGW